jgi:hypothetical protein
MGYEGCNFGLGFRPDRMGLLDMDGTQAGDRSRRMLAICFLDLSRTSTINSKSFLSSLPVIPAITTLPLTSPFTA